MISLWLLDLDFDENEHTKINILNYSVAGCVAQGLAFQFGQNEKD